MSSPEPRLACTRYQEEFPVSSRPFDHLRSDPMSFTLPELPYKYDALAPYMSRETLEYHHDKHHLAYVNNANNLRSEEHTSELQSQSNLVCRLLLEKKKETH